MYISVVRTQHRRSDGFRVEFSDDGDFHRSSYAVLTEDEVRELIGKLQSSLRREIRCNFVSQEIVFAGDLDALGGLEG